MARESKTKADRPTSSPMVDDVICVIEFPENTSAELLNFIEQCIQLPKVTQLCKEDASKERGDRERSTPDYGTGLQCSRSDQHNQVQYLYIGATKQRLLEIADYVDMKKRCIDGTLQVFSVDKCHLFENYDDTNKFFTVAEKQWMVLHELESVKVSPEFVLPGAPHVKLQTGSSLLKQCEHHGLINQIFPLHDDSLQALTEKWYWHTSLVKRQPLWNIKDYFGETVGMYFAFLDFYTSALVVPAVVGVVFYLFEFHKNSISSLMILASFNLIWSTAFLESWKRRANALAYSWGTTDIKIIEEARSNFHGDLGKSPVTGKVEPSYPKWKRMARFYFVSLPIVIFCLFVGVVAMVAYFWFEDRTIAWYNSFDEPSYYVEAYSYVPTIVYSVAIIVMNQLYRPLAIRLNEWENHRLQSTFDNHLTIKLVLFWFINTFMLMFYTAFYQQDLVALRKTVLTELIVTQAVDQLQETVLPYTLYRLRKRGMTKETDSDVTPQSVSYRTQKESMKEKYEGTFDDFLELFIQYGYVTLFSCVSPLAAILSLLNNHIELKTDAVKLCRIHQRPFSKPAAGIGAWQVVFDIMGYLAIITNCALIGLCAHKAELLPSTSNINLLLIIVGLEHVLIMVRAAIAFIIPDAPKWVQIALAKDAYQLKTKFLASQAEPKKSL